MYSLKKEPSALSVPFLLFIKRQKCNLVYAIMTEKNDYILCYYLR